MKDIQLFDVNPNTGKITFSLNKTVEIVRGRKALVQLITLNLLNDRGSNTYNTNKGSTIPSIMADGYNEGEEDVVKTLIAIAVSDTEQQILNEQRRIAFAPDELDDKLKDLEILSIKYNQVNASWDIKILVRTEANNIGIIGL